MATVTVRLIGGLNKSLETVSEQTGIPKASLILYAQNDRLRIGIELDADLFQTKGAEPVRFTLRMPDSLKKLLEDAASESKVSVNWAVNVCVYQFNQLFWKSYRS